MAAAWPQMRLRAVGEVLIQRSGSSELWVSWFVGFVARLFGASAPRTAGLKNPHRWLQQEYDALIELSEQLSTLCAAR